MRSLLLDTNAAIRLTEGAPMRDDALIAIRESVDGGRQIYVSPFTAWEVGMLVSKGRLTTTRAPDAWWAELTAQEYVATAPMPGAVLIASSFLPGNPPSDPADRILGATARAFGFTLITRDRELLGYAHAGHINAIEC